MSHYPSIRLSLYHHFIDENSSSCRTVSATEMEAFFAESMPEHAKGVHMMIAAFDHNGDGEVNLEEAMEMYQARLPNLNWRLCHEAK